MQRLHQHCALAGGPCKYALRVGSGISDQWLMENVVPCLLQQPQVQQCVSLVLALPILWACFDPRMEDSVPQGLQTRIRDAYARLQVLGADVNPVKSRVLLVVTGYENLVQIDKIVKIVKIGEGGQAAATADEPAGGNEERRQEGRVGAIAGSAGADLDQLQALYAQNMISMRCELQEVTRSNLESATAAVHDANEQQHQLNWHPPARPNPSVCHAGCCSTRSANGHQR